MSRFSPFGVLCLFFLSVGLLPAAEPDWPIGRGPSKEPAPYRYDPATLKGVKAAYLNDYAACVLYTARTHTIEADGTVEMLTHDVIRINNRRGLEERGEHRSISFEPDFEKVTLHEARIHKPGGKVVELQPDDLHLRDANTDFQLYDRVKQVVISFPGLEAGDVFEVKWTVRGKNPEFQGQFFTAYPFGDLRDPIVREQFAVRLPEKRAFPHALTGDLKVEKESKVEAGMRTTTWSVNNVLPAPDDKNMPPDDEETTRVTCSTFASWDEVDVWNRKLVESRSQSTDEIKALVRTLTKDLKTPEDKVRVLATWVRRNVRYLSAGANHGFTPHAPGHIFAKRHGDCKDVSHLLIVLLREAGITGSYVSITPRNSPQILETVPSPASTHAIAMVRLGGKDHWIDCVYPHAGWNFLPVADRDRVVFVQEIDANGKPVHKVMRTPILAAGDNRTDITTRIKIDKMGMGTADRTETSHGQAALTRREEWLDQSTAVRRRKMSEELLADDDRNQLKRLTLTEANLRDLEQPVQARIEYGIDFGQPDKDLDIRVDVNAHELWGRLLRYTIAGDRTVPLDLGDPFELRYRFILEAPAACRFQNPPENATAKSAWGTFTRTVKPLENKGRRIEIEFVTKIDKVRIEPAAFGDFLDFQSEIRDAYRVALDLTTITALEDAAELEQEVSANLDDLVSTRVLVELYQKHQKFDLAQKAIDRAIEANPKERVFVEMSLARAEMAEKFALTERAKAVSDRARARVQLARLSVSQDKFDAAEIDLDKAAAADANVFDNLEGRLLQLRVFEKTNRPAKALLAARGVLKLEAENFEALTATVRIQLGASNPTEALTFLRRCTLATGGTPERLAEVAELHFRMNRLDDAFEIASRATTNNPHPRADRVLGLVLADRSDVRAIEHLERADLDARVMSALIRTHLATGSLTGAEQAAQRYVDQIEPKPVPALIARVREMSKQRSAMLAEIAPPAEKMSQWSAIVSAVLCARSGYGDPEKLVKSAFRAGFEFGPAYGVRGRLALERGRLAAAMSDAEKAIAMDKKDVDGWYVRGRVRLEREATGALDDLEMAAKLSGRKDAAVLSALGQAFFVAGRFREAIQAQQEAVDLDPNDEELAAQLKQFRAAGAEEK